MLIDLAVPLAPVVELAGRHTQPRNEPPGTDLGLLANCPKLMFFATPNRRDGRGRTLQELRPYAPGGLGWKKIAGELEVCMD